MYLKNHPPETPTIIALCFMPRYCQSPASVHCSTIFWIWLTIFVTATIPRPYAPHFYRAVPARKRTRQGNQDTWRMLPWMLYMSGCGIGCWLYYSLMRQAPLLVSWVWIGVKVLELGAGDPGMIESNWINAFMRGRRTLYSICITMPLERENGMFARS